MGTLEDLKRAAVNIDTPKPVEYGWLPDAEWALGGRLNLAKKVTEWAIAGAPGFEADTARIAALEPELAAYRADAGGVDIPAIREWALSTQADAETWSQGQSADHPGHDDAGEEWNLARAVLALIAAYEAKCGEVVRIKASLDRDADCVSAGTYDRIECDVLDTIGVPGTLDEVRDLVDTYLEVYEATGEASPRDAQNGAGLLRAINEAARDLPAGYVIGISVERGAAGVALVDEDGEEVDVEIHEGDIAAAIREATAKAAGGAR